MTRATKHAAALTLLFTLAGCGRGAIDAIGLSPTGRDLGLVAHWTFDDAAGTVVRDFSGNGHDGTLFGTTASWITNGRFSQALHFEQGDYVAVNNFPDATSSWTVSAWVFIAGKDIGTGDATIVSTEDVFHGGWEMSLTALTGTMRLHFGYWTGPGSYDYAFYDCMECLVPDRWQHVTAVVDGAAKTLAFYLDGTLKIRESVVRGISPGSTTLYIGRWPTRDPPRLLMGSVDDISIWSRPLASAEIQLLTQAPAPVCTQPSCAAGIAAVDAGR